MAPELATDEVVVAVVMTLSACFVGYLGYRIRFHGDVALVAGYPRHRRSDDETLARVVGRTTLAVAVVTLAFGLAYPFLPGQLGYWAVYTAFVLGLAAYSYRATNRLVPTDHPGDD